MLLSRHKTAHRHTHTRMQACRARGCHTHTHLSFFVNKGVRGASRKRCCGLQAWWCLGGVVSREPCSLHSRLWPRLSHLASGLVSLACSPPSRSPSQIPSSVTVSQCLMKGRVTGDRPYVTSHTSSRHADDFRHGKFNGRGFKYMKNGDTYDAECKHGKFLQRMKR